MEPVTCTRCDSPLSTVAQGVVYVRCGHRPLATAQPPGVDLVRAYGRCAYRAGRADVIAGVTAEAVPTRPRGADERRAAR